MAVHTCTWVCVHLCVCPCMCVRACSYGCISGWRYMCMCVYNCVQARDQPKYPSGAMLYIPLNYGCDNPMLVGCFYFLSLNWQTENRSANCSWSQVRNWQDLKQSSGLKFCVPGQAFLWSQCYSIEHFLLGAVVCLLICLVRFHLLTNHLLVFRPAVHDWGDGSGSEMFGMQV